MDPRGAPDFGDGAAEAGAAEAGGGGDARGEVGRAAVGAADSDRAALGRADLGRLRWRCRRGMRELDELLTRYVDEQYATAPPSYQAAFRELLDSHDPLIYDYFLGRRLPGNPVLLSLIGRITAVAAND